MWGPPVPVGQGPGGYSAVWPRTWCHWLRFRNQQVAGSNPAVGSTRFPCSLEELRGARPAVRAAEESVRIGSVGSSVSRVEHGRVAPVLARNELAVGVEQQLRGRPPAVLLDPLDRSPTGEVERGPGVPQHVRVDAARRRLSLWDITPEQIAEIEKSGKPVKSVTLYSPASGYVVEREAFPNQRIGPEMKLYTIADLSRVWVMADVFEADAPSIRPGMTARVSVPGERAATGPERRKAPAAG